jgi:hypothetical protein
MPIPIVTSHRMLPFPGRSADIQRTIHPHLPLPITARSAAALEAATEHLSPDGRNGGGT